MTEYQNFETWRRQPLFTTRLLDKSRRHLQFKRRHPEILSTGPVKHLFPTQAPVSIQKRETTLLPYFPVKTIPDLGSRLLFMTTRLFMHVRGRPFRTMRNSPTKAHEKRMKQKGIKNQTALIIQSEPSLMGYTPFTIFFSFAS